MGVFGAADSDPSRKLEADIEFIKTRLDLIARQMSSGSTGADPNLDAKLRSIYQAVNALGASSHDGHAPDPRLDTIQADVKQILNSPVQAPSDLVPRFESLETKVGALSERVEIQNQTITALKDALRELLAHMRNG